MLTQEMRQKIKDLFKKFSINHISNEEMEDFLDKLGIIREEIIQERNINSE